MGGGNRLSHTQAQTVLTYDQKRADLQNQYTLKYKELNSGAAAELDRKIYLLTIEEKITQQKIFKLDRQQYQFNTKSQQNLAARYHASRFGSRGGLSIVSGHVTATISDSAVRRFYCYR